MGNYVVQLKDPKTNDNWFPTTLGEGLTFAANDVVLSYLNNAASTALGELGVDLGYMTLKFANNPSVMWKSRVPFSALIDDSSTGDDKVTSIIDGNF